MAALRSIDRRVKGRYRARLLDPTNKVARQWMDQLTVAGAALDFHQSSRLTC